MRVGPLPFACRFLDKLVRACSVSLRMRRGLEIRVAFAPTRLSAEHLRAAYEMVSAVVERAIVLPSEEIPNKRDLGIDVAQRRQRGAR